MVYGSSLSAPIQSASAIIPPITARTSSTDSIRFRMAGAYHVAAALLVLLAAVPASARDLTREPYLRIEETLPVLAVAGAADAWTALDLQERRAASREVNPLAQSAGKIVALQLAFVGAEVGVVHAIDRRHGRKWGKRTLWTLTAFKAGIAVYQYRQGRR